MVHGRSRSAELVEIGEREKGSRLGGLVVLPGLPVAKGSPVRDERASGMLSVPAPADEKTVCTNNSNRHPNPHIIHNLGVSAIPLTCQVGGKSLLGISGFASRNTINRIHHWHEVLLQFQTGPKVLVLLLLLVL